MTITRSMSKQPPPVPNEPPPPVAGQKRITISDAIGYIPSWAKPPPPGQIQKRSRLMPKSILDPRNAANKGPKGKRELLWKQYVSMLEKLERPVPKKPTIIDVNDVPVKVTPAMYVRHTPKTRIRALDRMGVFRTSCRPPTTKDFKPSKEYAWSERLTRVLEIVINICKIPHREVISLLSLSKFMHDNLITCWSLWKALDFHEMNNAGDRLVEALSMPRYHFVVESVNLEFAQDIEDKHFKLIRTKFRAEESLQFISTLNLDGCQNITNTGVKDITDTCPDIQKFSICKNLRVTDYGIKSLVRNCNALTHLNLSDCKNITDESLVALGNDSPDLESLDITRCEQVTDAGVIAIAHGCPCLKSLSLCGITGVTDKCLETLSQNCSDTVTTLDVNHCSGIKRRSQEELLQLFPNLGSSIQH